MTRPVSLALALILAACGTPEGRAGQDETGAPAHTIGPEGAGGLSAQTPFTVPAMERAFPELEVITLSDPDTPAFHIRETGGAAPLYIVTPDWTRGYAGAVATTSPDVSGPGQLRAGRSRLSDAPAELTATCAAPETAGEITLICEADRFRLEFSGAGDNPLLARQTFLPPVP
ncbi:putative lipoprotein [Hyphomonas neptunium ATCC 15444]|uniref:Putative lipoprotein n=2 Tax=Hyphomonas TaxID=85 RepID=Q0BYQ5_HYPNA|nr:MULTISPECIES: hypothetical protein [Hyphomonas]ABI77270.1 putative lipoprotein [Hyphomonas neptunium ATCC 15444]KCZ91514.1 putative lipoprotein [Hyphomonas hirschiana VP5]